jgi:protein TonB
VKPTVKFTPPVIKKDEEVKEEEKPPPQEELKDKAAGLETVKGDPNAIDPGIVDPGPGTVEAPQIFTYVEQMPEFPGGIDAIHEFLYKNINYPDIAKESNIQGRVTVRFVVNEEGTMSDFSVSKGIGGGCDEEAIRVLKKMGSSTKWKPGKQNGRAVKVYYTLPITFKLEG